MEIFAELVLFENGYTDDDCIITWGDCGVATSYRGQDLEMVLKTFFVHIHSMYKGLGKTVNIRIERTDGERLKGFIHERVLLQASDGTCVKAQYIDHK